MQARRGLTFCVRRAGHPSNSKLQGAIRRRLHAIVGHHFVTFPVVTSNRSSLPSHLLTISVSLVMPVMLPQL